eukprot:Em0001g3005a
MVPARYRRPDLGTPSLDEDSETTDIPGAADLQASGATTVTPPHRAVPTAALSRAAAPTSAVRRQKLRRDSRHRYHHKCRDHSPQGAPFTTFIPTSPKREARYQCIICQLFATYGPAAALKYDRHFRQAAAWLKKDHPLHWDALKDDLLHPQEARLLEAPHSVSYTPAGKEICHRFNAGRCPKGMQLVSALAHQEDIDAELDKEVQARKVLGPFPSTLRETSGPRGWEWYPKMNNKCRVILHLFAPEGHSVKDFIIREEFTIHYSTMDDAVALLGRLDRGALMAKLDLQAAFRMVPVLASEWELLRMYWHDKYHVDTCLPFGLNIDARADVAWWDRFLPSWNGQPMLDTSTSTAGRALEDHLQLLITRAVAPSTPSTYRAGTRRYISFCQAYGLKSLPRSKHTIVLFGTSAGHSRLTPSRPKRLQLTNTMLDRMLGLLNTDSLLMLKAALTLGFFGLLRVIRMTTLNQNLSILQDLLHRLGYNSSQYNTHSLRIGAATAAAQAGLPPSTIQRLGQWRSSVFTTYARHPLTLPSHMARIVSALTFIPCTQPLTFIPYTQPPDLHPLHTAP